MDAFNAIYTRYAEISVFVIGDYEENELILYRILGTFL